MLDKLLVTTLGEVVPPSNKIFSNEVLDEKKMLDKQKKFQENIKKSNTRQMNEIVRNSESLFTAPLKRQKLNNLEGKIHLIFLIIKVLF